jgi:hypothetical protein
MGSGPLQVLLQGHSQKLINCCNLSIQKVSCKHWIIKDFEELYQNLKKLLKTLGKRAELPPFPKKPSQKDNQDEAIHLLQPL